MLLVDIAVHMLQPMMGLCTSKILLYKMCTCQKICIINSQQHNLYM